MRVLGEAIAGSLWILCASVPRAAAAANPAVIAAARGRLAHMPAYAGPGGERVPDTTGASTAGGHSTVAAASGQPALHPEPSGDLRPDAQHRAPNLSDFGLHSGRLLIDE